MNKYDPVSEALKLIISTLNPDQKEAINKGIDSLVNATPDPMNMEGRGEGEAFLKRLKTTSDS